MPGRTTTDVYTILARTIIESDSFQKEVALRSGGHRAATSKVLQALPKLAEALKALPESHILYIMTLTTKPEIFEAFVSFSFCGGALENFKKEVAQAFS